MLLPLIVIVLDPLQPGEVLAEKYRIDGALGVGGMGMVFAAHHLKLDQRVAIKVLHPELLSSSDAVGRFVREARAAVRIQSEHVARIWDVETRDDGTPYIVMEFLEGEDLAAWLQAHGPLPVQQAVEFVLQAGEAIAEAHTLGIVHRDLKPSNLFVIRRADGLLSVKVLDFGIAKVERSSTALTEQSVTNPSAVVGSPRYMSPEQLQSPIDIDLRSDIWSLGIVLYELLSGDCPFTGVTLGKLIADIVSMPPAPLRERLPNVPEGLEAVILKCLERDRNQRYASIAEFASALQRFAPKRARASVDRIIGVQNAALGLDLSSSSMALEAEGSKTLAVTVTPIQPVVASRVPRFGAWVALVLGGVGIVLGAAGWSLLAAPAPAPTVVKVPPTALTVGPNATGLAGRPSVGDEASASAQPVPQALPAASNEPAASPRPRPRKLPPPAPTPGPNVPAAKPAPAKPAPKANCTPNFYFDSQGEKHFKPECF